MFKDYPHNWEPVLLHHFLLKEVAADPEKVAIVSNGSSYTYRELAAAAKAYSNILYEEAGLRHGDTVAALMNPGFESISLLCACSALGLVFVPFNSDLPRARVAEVCSRVKPRLFVTGPGAELSPQMDEGFALGYAHTKEHGLTIMHKPEPSGRTQRRVLENDLAYIIFTSGSTGTPKGVMVSHRAAVVAFRGITYNWNTDPSYSRFVCMSPLGFDMSLLDISVALGSGGTIHFIPRDVVLHPHRLLEYLRDNRIEQLHGVPTLFSMLLELGNRLSKLSTLRRVILGGEEVSISLVNGLHKQLPALDVGVMFGQTESVIACSSEVLPNPLPPHWTALPLGNANPGTEILLIGDDGKEITEYNRLGEVYQRGTPFIGYFQDPEATARALVADPTRPGSNEMLLKTGDLARRTPWGLIFAGRCDDQVQIRGNRVELKEIEHTISQLPNVEVVVLAPRVKNDQYIKAVIATTGSIYGDEEAVRKHCREHLPAYMMPTRIVFATELPRLPSGKLNRAALDETA